MLVIHKRKQTRGKRVTVFSRRGIYCTAFIAVTTKMKPSQNSRWNLFYQQPRGKRSSRHCLLLLFCCQVLTSPPLMGKLLLFTLSPLLLQISLISGKYAGEFVLGLLLDHYGVSFPMLSNFRGDVYTIQLELMVPHLGTMRRQEN